MVYQILAPLLDQLVPARCLNCGSITRASLTLCENCSKDIITNAKSCLCCALPMPVAGQVCGRCQQHRPDYDQALATLLYGGMARQLVTELKFQGKLANAGLLASLFHERLPDFERPQCLVPIPLHTSRLRERGYNQSLEIARVLGKLLDIPIDYRLANRRRPTARQAELPRRAKRANVFNAFEATTSQIPGHIAVIDDVMTSGHTLNEFARVMKKAGAHRVQVWAMTRAGSSGH